MSRKLKRRQRSKKEAADARKGLSGFISKALPFFVKNVLPILIFVLTVATFFRGKPEDNCGDRFGEWIENLDADSDLKQENALSELFSPEPCRFVDEERYRSRLYVQLARKLQKDAESGGKAWIVHQVANRFQELSLRRFAENDDPKGLFLQESRFDSLQLQHCDFRGVRLERATLKYVNLERAILTEGRLVNSELHSAVLDAADLAHADLSSARLEGASLLGTDLRHARLEKASLREAHLQNARLDSAKLWNADLRKADLTTASLSGAQIAGADLRGAIVAPAVVADASDWRLAVLDPAVARNAEEFARAQAIAAAREDSASVAMADSTESRPDKKSPGWVPQMVLGLLVVVPKLIQRAVMSKFG